MVLQTRKVDELGRVVLPKEIRNSMNLSEGDEVEFSLSGALLQIRKSVVSCKLCGNRKDLQAVNGTILCLNCIKQIKDM